MPANAIPVPLARFRLGRLDDGRLAARSAAGDEPAFEALYDRHHRALLGFCRHMLGSREEAEDALQQTFLRAHRALLSRGAPDELRPWLFAIARNRCLTLLAARMEAAIPDERLEPATEGLGSEVERRADLRALLGDIQRLPPDQRSALVLAELADLPHAEIASVIGVPATKVRALVHQARSRLIAEREARETPCEQVRERLATARGGQLRRGPLRRHLAVCDPCRAYKAAVVQQRAALALVLPVLPSAGLKEAVLGGIAGGGGAGSAAVVGAAAGGSALPAATGLAAKLAVGAALAGGAGGGAIVVEDATREPKSAALAAEAPAKLSAAPGRSPLQRAPVVMPATGRTTPERPADEPARRRATAERPADEPVRARRGGKRPAPGPATRRSASRQKAPTVVKNERATDRAAAKERRRTLRDRRTRPSPPSRAPHGRSLAETSRPPSSRPGPPSGTSQRRDAKGRDPAEPLP
jgi:RNA polymerase sigma factor (sigma-70 family)